ncbi:MAG: cell division ATP-binding protein FtsE [Pseudomonadota bacterium]
MIELFHVTKTYENETHALYDVSLQIEKSDFIFLTGASGAGKTTLLRLIFGAEPASSGQILVGGHNVSALKAHQLPMLRRKMGIVFQDFKLIQSRTIYENVSFTLEVLGLSQKEIKRKTWNVLKDVGLQHRMNHFPKQLSGGEQQRAAIARALVNDPLIMIADEPTGNLDWDLTLEIMNYFNRMNARGTTILIATHNQNILKLYNKKTIHLEKGRIA